VTAEIVFDDEVMLAGWRDSSDKGQWVRLWLDHDSVLHPFAGFNRRKGDQPGDYFACAFVATTEPGSGESIDRPNQRKESQRAWLMINSQRFRQWLEERCEYTAVLERKGRRWDPETVKSYVKWKLKIESLSELDKHNGALERFDREFREPFVHWADR
jgi:hypothetical protein